MYQIMAICSSTTYSPNSCILRYRPGISIWILPPHISSRGHKISRVCFCFCEYGKVAILVYMGGLGPIFKHTVICFAIKRLRLRLFSRSRSLFGPGKPWFPWFNNLKHCRLFESRFHDFLVSTTWMRRKPRVWYISNLGNHGFPGPKKPP